MKMKNYEITEIIEVDVPNTYNNVEEYISNIRLAESELRDMGYTDMEVKPEYSTYLVGRRLETEEETRTRRIKENKEGEELLVREIASLQESLEKIRQEK